MSMQSPNVRFACDATGLIGLRRAANYAIFLRLMLALRR
jgi:hypothetical protein